MYTVRAGFRLMYTEHSLLVLVVHMGKSILRDEDIHTLLDLYVHVWYIIIWNVSIIDIKKKYGNVLFFPLQFGTCLLTFWLDALAILRVMLSHPHPENA